LDAHCYSPVTLQDNTFASDEMTIDVKNMVGKETHSINCIVSFNDEAACIYVQFPGDANDQCSR